MLIRRLSPVLLIALIVLFIAPVYAQDDVNLPTDRAVITPENVAQLQPLGRYGTGELSDAFAWSPDESTLAIGGSTGIWLYASDALTIPFDFIPTDQYVQRLWFSPDGQYLAYQTYHSAIHLLDYATRSEIEIFEDAQTIAFHPEQAYLMVGVTRPGVMGKVEAALLWDMQTRETLKTFFVSGSDWGGRFINMDFSADGTMFAAAWRSGDYSTCGDSTAMVKWWTFDDILNNYTEEELGNDYESGIGHPLYGLYDVKFHPILNVFVSIHAPSVPSPPPSILVLYDPLAAESTTYDLGTMVTTYEEDRITTYNESIAGFAFSSRSYDDETDMGTIDVVIKGTLNSEDAIHTIEMADGKLQQKLTFGDNITAYAAVPHMTVAMDGRYRVSDGTGRLVNIGATGMSRFSAFNNAMNHAINDDGSAFLTRDIDGAWRLWTLDDEVEEIALPAEYQGWIPRFIPGGRMVKFDSVEEERLFALWDFNAGTTFEIDAANMYDDWREADFSPNGERMAVQRRSSQIEIYDTSSGILLSTLDSAFDRRTQLVFSPDSQHLTTAHFIATGDLNTSTIEVREWTSDTGELHRDYGTFASSASYGEINMGQTQVRYSTDGARLSLQSNYVRVNEENPPKYNRYIEINVFDVTSGETVFTRLEPEEEMVYKWGLFSDDLRFLALDSGAYSSTRVELYDVQRDALIVGNEPNIRASYGGGPKRFSPNNSRLVLEVASTSGCGGDAHLILLHDVETLAEVAQIAVTRGVLNHAPDSLTFTSDSRMLMLSGEAGATFYDALTGELITEIDDLDNSRLHFNTDGTLLIAARDDGTVTLWGIPADSAD